MPISTVNTKIRSTVLCLSGFELYTRWVPLLDSSIHRINPYPVDKYKVLNKPVIEVSTLYVKRLFNRCYPLGIRFIQ